jgi:17beta-estradiol 17-dehydrogenase / very-long-chain 3-oxoacyl-CoA reductase
VKNGPAESDSKNYDGVDVKIVVCDYSNFDDKAQMTVKTALKGLDIGILINNVGVSYRYPQYYHEITDEEAVSLVEMNVDSMTYMTRMVLPGMIDNKRGAIINLSSGSAMYLVHSSLVGWLLCFQIVH